MMPGMSGVELHALLRRDPALAKIPVVVISGGARVDETAAGMNAAGLLVKPFELDALVAMVRKHVSPVAPDVSPNRGSPRVTRPRAPRTAG
jgi:DNA-binding response OmpR family regulator